MTRLGGGCDMSVRVYYEGVTRVYVCITRV